MKICVFGSSSNQTKQTYIDAAFQLGCLIAEGGHVCVNGAGLYGVMGATIRGCRSKGGKVLGIIHEAFCVDQAEDRNVDELIVVGGKGLNERKDRLFDESDCFLVLPGGVGTFDEFFDGVCSRSLNMKGLYCKRFCLVSIDGFYEGFRLQMKRAMEDGVLYLDYEKFFHIAPDVQSAYNWCIENCADSSMDVKPGEGVRMTLRDTDKLPPSSFDDRTKPTSSSTSASSTVSLSMPTALLLTFLGFALGYSLRKK
jgi:uncharacterized protein (TIGR00730 family)